MIRLFAGQKKEEEDSQSEAEWTCFSSLACLPFSFFLLHPGRYSLFYINTALRLFQGKGGQPLQRDIVWRSLACDTVAWIYRFRDFN
jgi:hypothetical protein